MRIDAVRLADGQVVFRPRRENFSTDYNFACAVHDFNRRVESEAWSAFDSELAKQLRKGRKAL